MRQTTTNPTATRTKKARSPGTDLGKFLSSATWSSSSFPPHPPLILIMLDLLAESWAYIYHTYAPLYWFLGSWVALVALYWIVGGMYLVIDMSQRPALLYRYKIQPARAFDASGGAHNPSLLSLVVNSLVIQSTVFLPGTQPNTHTHKERERES
jgi:hypothetical protein